MSDFEKEVRSEEGSNEPRETIWYTIGELVKMVVCPGCGISMVSFKNRFAHIKKCFSIKRRGPLYRIHGYAECKCGFLIADTEKARKLHCCSGKLRPCKPFIPAEAKPPAKEPAEEVQPSKREQALQPLIRNFISPIKQHEFPCLDISYSSKSNPKPTSRPRVRNFDRPPRSQAPKEVCVYSIIRRNGTISVTGRSIVRYRGGNENLAILKKRVTSRLQEVKMKNV
ncbi:uncharacterized protein LOC6531422 [Drosophila yakuba]|uniref:Uncharacterized protein, isoform B n=1 Tax=Drosophila yakuba TaxID=7245 RepID=A0A0R1DSL7_DROYA|nr:uncharacterized protein LOC6531422 [Drosophila yakuba]XP_015051323.1 uncharacterized protein LOC6531422 [Drosophila yakuba]KRK00214.1 uncharacterized protein Dyak_GE14070, isoform B [Drosophila yakuba]KRK00215.1 uncharacterized protein Dyak_GE14070, isoform C [Drosophila yakuba]